ncbi:MULTISPECIES: hypothetical protein [unclassified Kitasatospora]
MVQEPVDRRGGDGLGMIVPKPAGWMLLVTIMDRRSWAASITR